MEKMIDLAIEAARLAGEAIMAVYAQPFEVYTKDDDSPVTQADLRASRVIKEVLEPTGLPFVSEEDLPADRSGFGRYWLVDPLDGTAEFVKRNGEFTVNIALIEDKRPVLGVIYAPVTGGLWAAGPSSLGNCPSGMESLGNCISPFGRYDKVPQGLHTFGRYDKVPQEGLPAAGDTARCCGDTAMGALHISLWEIRQGAPMAVSCRRDNFPPPGDDGRVLHERPFTVLVSRSHRTPEVDAYIDKVLRPAHPDLVIDSQGSSLKFARLVEGTADVYVCYSKTKEWDTAAADAILTAAGGKVLRISDGLPLAYDKDDYPNPPFVAWAP